MLNFSAALWPLFWTILGSGAVLTIALCWMTAVIRPRRRHSQVPRHHQVLPTRQPSTHPLRRAALWSERCPPFQAGAATVRAGDGQLARDRDPCCSYVI